jgi:hypothetical protein
MKIIVFRSVSSVGRITRYNTPCDKELPAAPSFFSFLSNTLSRETEAPKGIRGMYNRLNSSSMQKWFSLIVGAAILSACATPYQPIKTAAPIIL